MNNNLASRVSWDEFQRRKDYARKEILTHAAARVLHDSPSRYTLDLKLLPVLNAWDDIPFSFTVFSCSGIPQEHNETNYSPVNGLQGNPHALIHAHSYTAHPLFLRFNNFLEKSLEGKGDVHRSGPMKGEYYSGIFLHVIHIDVPKVTQDNADLDYLTNLWNDFHLRLVDFNIKHKHHRDWNYGI
ncbi:MAG: hypothetical protein ACMXYG_04255 [Candidatus Woesearchaeota archaeon]